MNLIITYTPLHVLIAERIIQEHPKEQFFCLMFNEIQRNEKAYAYYQRLRKQCARGMYVIYKEPLGDRVLHYKHLFTLLKCVYRLPSGIKAVYTPRLDKYETALCLRRFPTASLITYDDGLANLNSSSFYQTTYFIRGRAGLPQRLFPSLLKPLTFDELFARQTLHYSIFKYPNAMPKSTYLPLLDVFKESVEDNAPENIDKVRILLGQPIYEFLPQDATDMNVRLTERTIKHYAIDYYFPHPRENYKVTGGKYIESDLVFEDWLLHELRGSNKSFEIYSYCSTIIFNVSGVSRVKLHVLRPNDTPEGLNGTYDLFEKLSLKVEHLPYGGGEDENI